MNWLIKKWYAAVLGLLLAQTARGVSIDGTIDFSYSETLKGAASGTIDTSIVSWEVIGDELGSLNRYYWRQWLRPNATAVINFNIEKEERFFAWKMGANGGKGSERIYAHLPIGMVQDSMKAAALGSGAPSWFAPGVEYYDTVTDYLDAGSFLTYPWPTTLGTESPPAYLESVNFSGVVPSNATNTLWTRKSVPSFRYRIANGNAGNNYTLRIRLKLKTVDTTTLQAGPLNTVSLIAYGNTLVNGSAVNSSFESGNITVNGDGSWHTFTIGTTAASNYAIYELTYVQVSGF